MIEAKREARLLDLDGRLLAPPQPIWCIRDDQGWWVRYPQVVRFDVDTSGSVGSVVVEGCPRTYQPGELEPREVKAGDMYTVRFRPEEDGDDLTISEAA